MQDKFLNITLSEDNMDIYATRISIKGSLESVMGRFKGKFIDLGCGDQPYREYLMANTKIDEYIGIDIDHPNYHSKNKPDVIWDGETLPFANNSIDVVMATEVFEHVPKIEKLLLEINRVLKIDGMLFFTVPYLWPLHDIPFDEYRYTPYSLERHLRQAGFVNIDLKPMGGWNASLAQMIGLWVNRSPKTVEERERAKKEYFPLYKELMFSDSVDASWSKSTMITGISGTAHKRIQASSDKVLAIYVCKLGIVTETFIKRHIAMYDANKTVIISGDEERETDIEFPIFRIRCASGFHKMDEEEGQFIEFIRKHQVSHFLVEFGNVGAQIVEVNSRLLQLPLYVHFHGYDASSVLLQKHIVEYYRWLNKNISGAIVGSNDMKKRLCDHGFDTSKVLVNRYGIEIPSMISGSIEDEICKFVFIGRFVNKKAPLLVLDAFFKASAINPNIFLDVVGDDNSNGYTERIRQFIEEHNLGEKVCLHGFQEHDYVKTLLGKSSCYIQHSIVDPETGDMEGVPNIILEASSYGLPIVSTKHAGIPEAVDHGVTGYLVEEQDVETMAEYMVKLSLDPLLRKKFGLAGRDKMLSLFTAEQSIQGLKEILFLDIPSRNIFKYYPLPNVASNSNRASQKELEACEFLSKKIENLPSSKPLVIYGFGIVGELVVDRFKNHSRVIGIIDNQKAGQMYENIRIRDHNSLKDMQNVVVVLSILNEKVAQEIYRNLMTQENLQVIDFFNEL